MTRSAPRSGVLWATVLAPPAAWFAHLFVGYALVDHVCATGRGWLLHLLAAAALGVTLGSAWVAWRGWRRLGSPGESAGDGADKDAGNDAENAGDAGRGGERAAPDSGGPGGMRFLAASGTGLGLGFSLAVVVGALPAFVLGPCA